MDNLKDFKNEALVVTNASDGNTPHIVQGIEPLWTFDKYPGYSVEANYEGNSATNNGVDFGGYPISRTFTFGLNFNF